MEEVVQVEKVHRCNGSDERPSAAFKSAAGEVRFRQRDIADPDAEPRGENAVLVELPRWERLWRERQPQWRQHVEGVLVRGQLVGAGSQ